MPFTIAAERHCISTYNRRTAAWEAFFLASLRVPEGAEEALVYDDRGKIVSAPILADPAREEVGAVRAVRKAVTWPSRISSPQAAALCRGQRLNDCGDVRRRVADGGREAT